jgi:hypothetical protein
MNQYVQSDVDYTPNDKINYTTEEFLEYIEDLDKEVQNARINCDPNTGHCNFSMNFVSVRPERGINGTLDCSAGDCDLGIKFASARH